MIETSAAGQWAPPMRSPPRLPPRTRRRLHHGTDLLIDGGVIAALPRRTLATVPVIPTGGRRSNRSSPPPSVHSTARPSKSAFSTQGSVVAAARLIDDAPCRPEPGTWFMGLKCGRFGQQRESTLGIGPVDRKKLWGRSRNQCAFTSCLQALVDVLPGDGETDSSVIGEEAHIRSKSPDGPRYDPHYNPALLDSYENFLLLCPTHHTMIDKENGRGFNAKALVGMRYKHERQLQRSEYLEGAVRAFLAYQYEIDDRVRFEAVDINGLDLESLFVDVPVAWRVRATGGDFLRRLQRERPGDLSSLQLPAELGCQSTRDRVTSEDGRVRQIRGYLAADLYAAADAARDGES